MDKHGRKRRVRTTKGYDLLIKWKDGQQSWVPLKDAKESYPIAVADYTVAQGLD